MRHYVPFILSCVLVLLLTGIHCDAQQLELVRSGEVLQEARKLLDSSKYATAVTLLRKIDPRDTNYVESLELRARAEFADKKYDAAIAAAREGLALPSAFTASFMLMEGQALYASDNFDQAEKVFLEGMKRFPMNSDFTHQLGRMYYDKKDFAKALPYVFATLRLSPFSSGSNYILMRMSALQGMKTHALMAGGIYMAVKPKDNEELVFLEGLLKNEFPDEGSVDVQTPNAFERMDQLLKSQIAMDSKFKSRIPVDIAIVKQFQLFFDQLPSANDEQDPFVKHYIPVYAALKRDGVADAFVYHILKSTPIEHVKTWTAKNEKTLKTFYSSINLALRAHRAFIDWPEAGGKTPCNYDDDGDLESIGNMNGDKRIGWWKYFHGNGEISATGPYKNGIKTGTWKYYRTDGSISSEENQETGLIRAYHPNGQLSEQYVYRDKKIIGEFTTYNLCGTLTEKGNYADGKLSGPGFTALADGTHSVEYNYKNGEREGVYTTYHNNGVKNEQLHYVAGKRDGPYKSWYMNGALRSEGNYRDHKAEGAWLFYHDNGKISQKGTYTNDNSSGHWLFYDRHGNLTEEQDYNDKDQLHGDNIIYDEGTKRINHYVNGKYTGVTFFDANGKQIENVSDPSGNFQYRLNYKDGKIRLEGKYVNGKREGSWKFYFRNGKLETEEKYKEGLMEGVAVSYYESGSIKSELMYTKGKANGYYKQYHENGKVSREGWYVDEKQQQRWVNYYPDGQPDYDRYFLNGEVSGYELVYMGGHLIGRLGNSETRVAYPEYLGAQGQVISRKVDGNEPGRFSIEIPHSNGTRLQIRTYACSQLMSDIRNFADGKLFDLTEARNGRWNGASKTYFPSGQLESEGKFLDGDRSGPWIWFHENGKVELKGVMHDGERDSTWLTFSEAGVLIRQSEYADGKLHGITRIFTGDGKLLIEKRYSQGECYDYRTTGADGAPGNWITLATNATIKVLLPNGLPGFVETYRDGVLEGDRIISYSNGKPFSVAHFRNGDFEGDQYTYYANGQMYEHGRYTAGDLHGLQELFSADGKPRFSVTYYFGYRHGPMTLYEKGKVVKNINIFGARVYE